MEEGLCHGSNTVIAFVVHENKEDLLRVVLSFVTETSTSLINNMVFS